jgi:hypothetical protein
MEMPPKPLTGMRSTFTVLDDGAEVVSEEIHEGQDTADPGPSRVRA